MIDYEAVGGYGIVFTKVLTKKIVEHNNIDKDEFASELENIMTRFTSLELRQVEIDDHRVYCVLLVAENLAELDISKGLQELNELFGVEFTAKEIKRISELYWY